MNSEPHLEKEMAICYNSLVIESTTRCNAKCAHCCQNSGPKGSDLWGDETLTSEQMETVVQDAARIETLGKRFHLAGGESFLDLEGCLRLFELAKQVGCTEIANTTNAFWAKKPAKAIAICEQMRAAGVTRMEVSWDYWHSAYVSPDAVSNCLEASAETGIFTILRVLTTKSHCAPEALRMLRTEALAKVGSVMVGPVFPTGRAAQTIESSDFFKTDNLKGACFSLLNLVVNPRGNVFPCCAGLDQTDNLNFGNVKNESITEIAERMNNSLLLRILVFGGPSKLVPYLRRSGIEIEMNHTNMCHFCRYIFSDPDRTRILEKQFQRLERVDRALRGFRTKRDGGVQASRE